MTVDVMSPAESGGHHLFNVSLATLHSMMFLYIDKWHHLSMFTNIIAQCC